ncbi:MAG: FapA family protein, partial [Phycisphaeraceae bacterium]
GGTAVGVDVVLAWLRERLITTGVDMKALRRAIDAAAGGDDVKDAVVVRGRPPRPGQDGRIDRFGRKTADSPLIALSGHMLTASEVWMCKVGDLVLRHTPPEPGVPGFNAMGETIDPPAPSDTEITVGRHVRIAEHEHFAEVAGVVSFEGNRVEVRKALIFHQDLTHKSDPIDFDGEVHVHAAVRSRASIKATGNIMIDGPVEAAEIESTEADVILRSGVAGQGAAVIRAARDINARFAERASLFAGRNITLQVGSLHARLIAHHEISATQGKGHLAGGIVMAGEKVSVKQLGARGGVRTDVTVGLSTEVLQNLAEIDQLTARVTQRRDGAAELADQIRRAVGDPLKLKAKELHVYTRLQQLQLVCDVQIRKLNERRKQLLGECARGKAGKVEVMSSIMSNVGVTIGSGDIELDSRPGPCTLIFSEAADSVIVRRA